MGKQYNKVIKRRRRLAYVKRRKARQKAGIVLGRSKSAKADADKKPVKKVAVKKAKPAAKKPAPAPEVTTEAPAAVAEG